MTDTVQVKYVRGGKVVQMPKRYVAPLVKLGHIVVFEIEPVTDKEEDQPKRRGRKAKEDQDQE